MLLIASCNWHNEVGFRFLLNDEVGLWITCWKIAKNYDRLVVAKKWLSQNYKKVKKIHKTVIGITKSISCI
jgi:hypothetical protein